MPNESSMTEVRYGAEMEVRRRVSHEGTNRIKSILFYVLYIFFIFTVSMYYISTLQDPSLSEKIAKERDSYKKLFTLMAGKKNQLKKKLQQAEADLAKLQGRKPPPYATPLPRNAVAMDTTQFTAITKDKAKLLDQLSKIDLTVKARRVILAGRDLIAGSPNNFITNPNNFPITVKDPAGGFEIQLPALTQYRTTRREIPSRLGGHELVFLDNTKQEIQHLKVQPNMPPRVEVISTAGGGLAQKLSGGAEIGRILVFDDDPLDCSVDAPGVLAPNRSDAKTISLKAPTDMFISQGNWSQYTSQGAARKTLAGISSIRKAGKAVTFTFSITVSDGINPPVTNTYKLDTPGSW